MNRHAIAILVVFAALLAFGACGHGARASLDKSGAASRSTLQTKTLQKSAQKLNGPAQPITATATLTATIPLPTATPSATPDPCGPAGTFYADLFVAAGRQLYVEYWPSTGGRVENYLVADGEWAQLMYPFLPGYRYRFVVPGPSATIWPTPEDDTPTPEPLPTQTPWIVTATPEPTATAPPTASATATRAARALLLPMLWHGR